MTALFKTLPLIVFIFCGNFSLHADEKVPIQLNHAVSSIVLSGYVDTMVHWNANPNQHVGPYIFVPITLPGGRLIGYRLVLWDRTYRPSYLNFWAQH